VKKIYSISSTLIETDLRVFFLTSDRCTGIDYSFLVIFSVENTTGTKEVKNYN
jgi:hypothetical protein